MWNQWRCTAALAVVLTLGATAIGMAQSSQSNDDTYTWPGELVSVDTAGMTMTVKARVAYQEAVSELGQFKPGERVWVVWSGAHSFSDAVRQVRRFQAGQKIDSDFVLPADLVSPEAQNQYVTIRVKMPESSLAAVKAVKPGEWVTVTSRHRPSTDAEGVVAVKPFSSNATTS